MAAAKPDLTRGPVLLGISITTGIFALSTCLIRFCVRKRTASRIGWDDYAMGVAAVVALIGTIFSIIEGSSMTDSSHALEFDWLGQPWFMMGTAFAKISICLFFIRLVGSVKQWRILLSSQILLMVVLNFAFSLTTNLQCRPLDKLWDPSLPGVCWDPNIQLNIGYFQGAFSVFWWLFLSLFPVMIVRDLEMHQKMRWPFYFLSSLSLIAAIFATVRIYETSQTVPGVFTFDTFFATVLSILEQNVGIVAANILPMGALFWTNKRRTTDLENRAHGERRGQDRNRRNGQGGREQNPFESGAGSVYSTRHRGGGNYDDDEEYILAEDRGRQGGPGSSVKRTSMLIIEGPRKASFEEDDNNYNNLDTKNGGNETALRNLPSRSASLAGRSGRGSTDGRGNSMDETGAESFWPRGIIKTVEVEVVEEDIADMNPQHRRLPSSASGIQIGAGSNSNGNNYVDGQVSRHSRLGSENDWATLLRAGPTPPASRGPSRQGY